VLLRDTTILLAVPAALAVGVIVGLVNGVLTTRLRIPSFLVTLGTAGIVGGLARIITDLQAVPVTDEIFTTVFGSGEVGPFSSLFLWTMIALAISHVVYRKTTFGRRVLATGGNRTAARFSGIDTNRVRIAVLVICSFTAAMAGIMYAARLHGARYTLGEADLLTVIARQWAYCSQKAEEALAHFEPNQVLRLRYEDFVADPLSDLERICLHCGLTMTREMVRAAQDWVKSDRQLKWRRFDPCDLIRLLPELADEMQRHGYEIPPEIAQAMEPVYASANP
jgi:ABC-type xylose transport system permease subunit